MITIFVIYVTFVTKSTLTRSTSLLKQAVWPAYCWTVLICILMYHCISLLNNYRLKKKHHFISKGKKQKPFVQLRGQSVDGSNNDTSAWPHKIQVSGAVSTRARALGLLNPLGLTEQWPDYSRNA